MPIIFSAITPHPPIIIPTVGDKQSLDQISSTIKAMEKLGNAISEVKPDTIIIISPHAPLLPDTFNILALEKLQGNFANFGDLETNFSFKNDLEITNKIFEQSQRQNIPVNLLDESNLDHGFLVPLYYLTNKLPKVKIVPLAYSFLDIKTHFEYGKIIGNIASKSDKKIAVIASGDLSHRLTLDAPAEYSPRGKEFDEELVKLLKENKFKKILELDENLIEEAGECGFRSIIILLGVLDNLKCKAEVLSYEGPFGVGYLTTKFTLICTNNVGD